MRQSGDNDQELLARFRDGDPEAFRALVRPHLAALEDCARRRLGDAVQRKVSAADLVQEVQMVAFRRCGDFGGGGREDLRRWLFGIVGNRARKALERYATTGKRAVAREVTRGQRPDTLELLGPWDSPSVDAAHTELREMLAQARARLGRDEQELIRLVHDERLNLRQAAERLGRSYDAVRKQHARVMVRLGHHVRQLRGSADGPI